MFANSWLQHIRSLPMAGSVAGSMPSSRMFDHDRSKDHLNTVVALARRAKEAQRVDPPANGTGGEVLERYAKDAGQCPQICM